MHPPYVNRCWDQAGVMETYQLLLQQDQQLRLLQSQVSKEQTDGRTDDFIVSGAEPGLWGCRGWSVWVQF